MRSRHKFRWCLIVPLIVAACDSFGPGRVAIDRFSYTEAIAQSSQEQTLMNLVRLRYLDVPVFLDVSSVLTQYGWLGQVGVAGTAGLGGASNTLSGVGGAATLNYLERPTITYTPLSGADFTRRMLEPLPVDSLFAARYAGLPGDLLWMIGLQEFNGVHNASLGPARSGGAVDIDKQSREERRKFENFRALMILTGKLTELGAIEFQRDPEKEEVYLVIASQIPPAAEAPLREFREVLELDPSINSFLITGRTAGRRNEEITLRARSLLGIMNFLSRGIDLPSTVADGTAPATTASADERFPVPFHAQSVPATTNSAPPPGAFTAVKYRGHWFYIADSDEQSKLAFGLLRYLFQLKAPPSEKLAPLITVPVGG